MSRGREPPQSYRVQRVSANEKKVNMHLRTYWLLHCRAPNRLVFLPGLSALIILVVVLLVLTVHPWLSSSPTAKLVFDTSSPVACVVYSQPDFTTHTLYATGQNTLKNAGSIATDNHGGFFVADYGNNRVLHFPATIGIGAGPAADHVYGQSDFTSHAPHNGAAGLNYPHGVAVDANGGLYISDMFNNRVLHYSPGSVYADRVYGQPDFVTFKSNSWGLNARSLYQPQGLSVDSTGLYVADSANNRVLHYPVGSMIADRVYGQGTSGNSQANFTSSERGNGASGLNDPRDVVVDSSGLYVADSGNHRVVHYVLGNPIADRVYGQPDFAAASILANQGLANPTVATLNKPTQVALDSSGGLYIADRNNNRVVYYPPHTQTGANDPEAVRVFGQRGFTTSGSSTTASSFHGPGGVAVDTSGNVFVLDIFNQRVLKFGERCQLIC
jgi:sugar lactone lactonase YvrE